jgi:hypothetical protein
VQLAALIEARAAQITAKLSEQPAPRPPVDLAALIG